MPYSIDSNNKDCNGFAVIKESDKKLKKLVALDHILMK